MNTTSTSASRGRTLSHIWNAFRQLNPKNVASESERAIMVGVVGPLDLLRETAQFLLGEDPGAYDRVGDILILLPTPLESTVYALLPRFDIVLRSSDYKDSLPGVASERAFSFSSVDELPAVMKLVLREPSLSYAHLPLARALPAFRSEVALDTVQSVSIENAIFVASTSLGNIVPNPLQPLASVAESLGDIVVLTANQLRMLFRLAAVYGQKLGFRDQAPEIASILGAAVGWRSLAREAAGALPFAAGVVPKAAIAFGGTWALGDALVYYYTTGKRLTKEEMKDRFDAACEKGKAAAEGIVARLRESYVRKVSSGAEPGGVSE